MNELYEQKAKEISLFLSQKRRFGTNIVGASPFLDMLMELLQQLMPMILGCFATPKEALQAAKNGLNFFQTWRLKRAIKRHLDDDNMSGRLLDPLYDAILDVASRSSEEEVHMFFQAA